MTANRFQAPQTSTFNYTFLLPNSDTVTGTCVFSNYAHVVGPIQKKKTNMAEVVSVMVVFRIFYYMPVFNLLD